MTVRALAGVVEARLYVSRRAVLYSCAAAVVVALVQPEGIVAPFVSCCLLGMAMALDQTPGRHGHLDRCEQGAPLFGRELARAKALVPCIAGVLAALLFAGAQAARGSGTAAETVLVVPVAVVAVTLTALCATIRRGWTRTFYIVLAAAAGGAAYVLVVMARSTAAEIAYCAFVAFFALRQYGEALARYDPI